MTRTAAGVILAAVIFSASPAASFPTVHMSESIQQDWYFSVEGHEYMYASVVDFAYFESDEVSDNPDDHAALGRIDWGHTTPASLPIPSDEILRAQLYITGAWVNQDGSETAIEGLIGWDPTTRSFSDYSLKWGGEINPNISWNEGAVNVGLNSDDGFFRVDMAVFMMDYEGGDSSMIPEPATVALLALGLIGVGLLRRRMTARSTT